jgi:HEAT repeat protein
VRSTAFWLTLNHPQKTEQDLPRLLKYMMDDQACYVGHQPSFGGLYAQYGDEVILHFCKWLDHDDPALVSRAVFNLGLFGEYSAPAIPFLLKRIECEDDCKASEVLGRIGPKALTALTPLLTKDNVHARRHATFAVATMTQASSERVPLLRQQLKDEDAKVRATALSGLNALTTTEGPP